MLTETAMKPLQQSPAHDDIEHDHLCMYTCKPDGVVSASRSACLQADLISGLTVGVMAVPQSVSFAAMAGVPAAFGLYTAFVPVLAYVLMGSSRHLVRRRSIIISCFC